MLSMTMMPASASPVDNNCRFDAETLKTYCRAEIKVGQVIQFNSNESLNSEPRNPGCHHIAQDYNDDKWLLLEEHGPADFEEKCTNWGVLKDNVEVRSQKP
ncbi:MAG: hypothetical protein ACE5RQ_07285 [Nitrosopumilus sp.]